MNDYKFVCDMCKFNCNYNSAWLEHVSSEKHLRQGKPKIHKCKYEDCNHETFVSWNMKMHIMTIHSTKEERSKSKYYCNDCDKVFFAPLYYNKHMSGTKHSNQVKINKLSQDKIF